MSLQDFIDVALEEVGTEEEIVNGVATNRTKYGEWFGSNGVAWCGIFIAWCANEAGILTTASSAKIPYVPKLSYIPDVYDWYANNGRCLAPNMNASSANRLRPGDVVIIDTAGGTTGKGHAGIVVDVDYANQKAYVVEGNVTEKVQKFTYTNLVASHGARITYLCSNNVSIA